MVPHYGMWTKGMLDGVTERMKGFSAVDSGWTKVKYCYYMTSSLFLFLALPRLHRSGHSFDRPYLPACLC